MEEMRHIEQEEGLPFRGLQEMLTDINANQVSVSYDTFADLLTDAKIQSEQ
ncbi:hypothetical protein ACSHT0_09870 [Tepidicaulis sp. LMO-SS28]|uniref:hypothetical protein n=1 Tax=Tepidicaulis sp. LMO-SS28 TaxID=3447455 RepID=UPI003EE37733